MAEYNGDNATNNTNYVVTDTGPSAGDDGSSAASGSGTGSGDGGMGAGGGSGTGTGTGSGTGEGGGGGSASNGGGGETNGGGEGTGSVITVDAGHSGDSTILTGGVLTTPDNDAPVSVAAGNGANIADVNALSGNNGHVISAEGGAPGGSPITDLGVLTTPDSHSPVGAEIGNGQNVADANLLGQSDGLQNVSDALGGNTVSSGSGDHLVSAGAGQAGGTPLGDIGVMTTPDAQNPLGFEVGNGHNVADAQLLGNSDALQNVSDALGGVNGSSGDHLITANGGEAGDSHVADAGVLTSPDSQTPVGAEIGNGDNVANVDALSHSDLVSFPDLGGSGSDALAGIAPSMVDFGNLAGDGSSAGNDQALVDANTDGSQFVEINHDPDWVLGLNHQAMV